MAYKITEEVVSQIKQFASEGLTKEQIAAAMGWSERTLYNKIEKDVRVLQAIKEGVASGIQKVANALFVNATKHNNTTAQIFFLKNRAPDEWKDRIPEGFGETIALPVSVNFTMIDGRKDADQSGSD